MTHTQEYGRQDIRWLDELLTYVSEHSPEFEPNRIELTERGDGVQEIRLVYDITEEAEK